MELDRITESVLQKRSRGIVSRLCGKTPVVPAVAWARTQIISKCDFIIYGGHLWHLKTVVLKFQ